MSGEQFRACQQPQDRSFGPPNDTAYDGHHLGTRRSGRGCGLECTGQEGNGELSIPSRAPRR